ncbi:MAG: GDP-L-fucose synthase [Acidobacteriota bacterium]|nr:GDP-L-fucose synthase [Acidobacteriota bacterium]
MNKSARIYVAGHRGLVGSAITRRLSEAGFENLLLRTHAELDLIAPAAVEEFFHREQPEYVVMAAARVGGVVANNTYPAEFITENLAIELNVIRAAWKAGVRRLLFLGSSCIYPQLAPQPIKEEYLLTGPLEPTNRAYAIAKIAGVEMCASLNREYGTRFLCPMPCNLYGRGDNFDPENSHVIPGVLGRIHQAKINGDDQVVLWGTGTPRREFMSSDDLADACLFLMSLPDDHFDELVRADDRPPLINIGTGEDLTIRELAERIRTIVGYQGRVVFDASRPDGTPRKLLDVSRLQRLGWHARISLEAGLRAMYEEFLARTMVHHP